MNIIQHPQFGEVRTEKHNGEFVFCAADICEVIDLENVTKALYGLDDDEKLTLPIVSSGQKRDMNFVTESGLYALVIRSRKIEARKFRKWITSEVLPALRKYGTYSINQNVMDRALMRQEKLATKRLLKEISSQISGTDIKRVAKQCMTTDRHVYSVLEGEVKDVEMLSMLYARATGNIQIGKLFYTIEGCEHLMQQLQQLKMK